MKTTLILLSLLLTIAHSTLIDTKIDSSEFQEIMEDFVEVHKEAEESQNIGQIITTIKTSMAQNEKKYESFINSFRLSCKNAESKLSKFIKRLNKQLNHLKHKVNKSTNHAKDSNKQRQENSVNLSKAQKELENIKKQQIQLILDYHAGAAESDQRIIVVQDLENQIVDELANHEFHDDASFIELKNKLNEKTNKLKTLIMKSGNSLEAKALISLVDLASEHNFSDQSILRKILKLLRKLKNKLVEYRKQKESDINFSLEGLKNSEANLQSQVDELVLLGQKYISNIKYISQNFALLIIINLSIKPWV